ncbi:MAG: ribokinase [Eubacterium sp.]
MIINFGSLNIDYVYEMEKIVRPGETLSSKERSVFPGGKGLNQSVALARAGADVKHAGFAGKADAQFLVDILDESRVDTTLLERVEATNGHAIIQVDGQGENCIILYRGTNGLPDSAYVQKIGQILKPGDLMLFQNETSAIAEMMQLAKERGARIALNPSPMDDACLSLPLELVDIFMLNEIEGAAITGKETADEIMDALISKFPRAKIILTLGSDGAMYGDAEKRFAQPAAKCETIVDTTAAGDTFTGYYLAGIEAGMSDEKAILRATAASAICIIRMGAAPSIPLEEEVIF